MAEPFSRSVQKRIEAQTGEKLFTKRDLDLAVLEARIKEVLASPHYSYCAFVKTSRECNCWKHDRIEDLQKQKAAASNPEGVK